MRTAPRRLRTLLTTLMAGLLFALTVAAAAPASAAGRQMENRERGFMAGPACLEIDHGRTWSGASATVDWCSNYSQHMNWTAVSTGDGYYQLRPDHVSGMCLAVYGGSYADGTQVVQQSCTGGAHLQWKFVYVSGGFYEVVARHSGKCLDKSGWNTVQWNCHGGDWQEWSRPF